MLHGYFGFIADLDGMHESVAGFWALLVFLGGQLGNHSSCSSSCMYDGRNSFHERLDVVNELLKGLTKLFLGLRLHE